MANAYSVELGSIQGMIDSVKDLKVNVDLSAQQAVNRTITWTRTYSAREIMREVNFDMSYLSGRNGRIEITKRAKKDDLEAILTGRQRPTSLARFTSTRDPGLTRRQGGVTVTVKPGSPKFMKRAFLMRLNAGKGMTETKYNLGLAIRLRPGERLANKTKVQQIKSNLYLLYAPSVDQILRSVIPHISPDVSAYLKKEFNRLLQVNSNG